MNGKTRTSPHTVSPSAPQLLNPRDVLKALLAHKKPDPEVFLCLMIYAAAKHVCNQHWHAEAGQLLLEAYDETRLTLHQLVLTNTITKRECFQCAVDIARKTTRKFMRSRREWQLPADGNDHSISLKTGGHRVDGDGESDRVITSRADYKLARAEEDKMVKAIHQKRAYRACVAILGAADARWLQAYVEDKYIRRSHVHTGKDRIRASRLRKKVRKCVTNYL